MAAVFKELLNFHWFLSGWVAVFFGVPGLSAHRLSGTLGGGGGEGLSGRPV